MKTTKKTFRFFTLFEFEEEQNYLEMMHKNGWKVTGFHLPGFYKFQKCEGEDYTYRIDFTDEKFSNPPEYRQLFSDNGWEFLWQANGFSIFRKPGKAETEDNEIFTDNNSKFTMIKKIFQRRFIPITIIFCGCVLPNFFRGLGGNFGADRGGISLTVFFGLMFVLYIYILCKSIFRYRQLKQKFANE